MRKGWMALHGTEAWMSTSQLDSLGLNHWPRKLLKLQKFPVQTTFVWVISPDGYILNMKITKDHGDHFLQTKLRDVQVTLFPVESLCHCIGSTTQPDKRLAKLPCFALLEAYENCRCFLQLNRWHDSQLQVQKAKGLAGVARSLRSLVGGFQKTKSFRRWGFASGSLS